MKTENKTCMNGCVGTSDHLKEYLPPQFPTVQEQIDYWNTKERLEHERVMNIRAESPNDRSQTGEVTQVYNVLMLSDEYGGEEFGEYPTLNQAYQAISRLALSAAKLNDGILREFHVTPTSDASSPQEQASTTALTLDQTEATCDYLDEQERNWTLREAGSNDGEGESYASRNV